jgi:protein TonB
MFETVLAGHPLPRRRGLAGPLSIALHAAALAAIVAGSAWRLTDPGEPTVALLFRASPAVPPGPAAPAAAHPGSPRPGSGRPDALAPRFLAPSVIPVRIDLAPAAAPLDAVPEPEGTGPGAVPGEGVDGGTGDGPARGVGGDSPIPATAPDVAPPRLLFQAQPEFPEAARRARLQGAVLLQAVIGTAGDVEDVRVVSSSSPLFEEAAIRAVREWRYTPATLARRPVRVYLTVTIRFSLR